MRVVGGRLKGRVLSSFKGMSIRPTSDKVREAIFNILPRESPFGKVLDLFAGTGAMGIEALSRGAKEAVFVDKDQSAVNIIYKNLETCSLGAEARVLKKDVKSAVKFLAAKGEKFDLIFIDPPYDSSLVNEALKAVSSEGILERDGYLVAESSKRVKVQDGFPGLKRIDERKYGDTAVYFYIAEKKDA